MREPTRLRFIQLLPKVPPRADFLLRDLPGSGHRIDVLCRDLAACFEWGPASWERSSIELVAVLQGGTTITFNHYDKRDAMGEVGWAQLIQDALMMRSVEGIKVTLQTLENLLEEIMSTRNSEVFMLHEAGGPFQEVVETCRATQNSFMLGDHRGFDSQTEEILTSYGVKRVSLGERSYLSSHCISAIISRFERMCR